MPVQNAQPNQATPVQIPQEIQQYLETLLQEAQVPVTDVKTKAELVQYLFTRLDRYLAVKIFENLSEEDAKNFTKMTEEGKSQEEIQAFIKDHMKNAEDVFAHAFVDFRDFYLTGQAPVAPAKKN